MDFTNWRSQAIIRRQGTRCVRLNLDLQQALNPDPTAKVERFGSIFATGDKIMQIVNDYEREVFNGDLGTVAAIDTEEAVLMAEFDGRKVEYGFAELDVLVPAYATTIHKSQGSEYPAVVITMATQHYNAYPSSPLPSTCCR
jgi:exodeoxyribonuclease V alpha subunit